MKKFLLPSLGLILLGVAASSLIKPESVEAQNPSCPTRPVGDSTNACASTKFVSQNSVFLPLCATGQFGVSDGSVWRCSLFSGITPLVPTATPGTSTTQAASTEFVTSALSGISTGISIAQFGATCSGGGGPDNTTAIQNAINAVPLGGTLYIPQCPSGQAYRVIGSGTTILTITQPIRIRGDGMSASILFVDASVPNTRDVITIAPSGTQIGYNFSDFAISSFGLGGRHGLHFNVPLGEYAFNVTVQRMFIGQMLGGNSIRLTNNVSTTSGGLAYSSIDHNNLESIYLDLVGDGINISNNNIGATGTNIAIRASFVAGAGGFVVNSNVITGFNCFICLVNGVNPTISFNELETPVSVANTYGFLIDLNTSAAATMLSPQLISNGTSVLTGTSNPIPIRVRNNTANARIADARLLNQTGAFIQVDAGATDTAIDNNIQYVQGGSVVARNVSDSGTRTIFYGPSYLEGSWTPTLIGSTSGSWTLSTALGSYEKIGRFVHLEAVIVASGASAPVGNIVVGGLPFAPVGLTGACLISIQTGLTNSASYTQFQGNIAGGGSATVALWESGSGQNSQAAAVGRANTTPSITMDCRYNT